ncbi:hypothetical protein GW17_00034551 [Ensete ventricosum]|nr:hypothetical protein GW17_00034551 [Ensete ventricosum]
MPPSAPPSLSSCGTSRAGDRSCQRPFLQAAALAAGLPLEALQREAATCGLAAGGCPLRPGRERCLRQQAPPLQAPAMPTGDCACCPAPLQGALAAVGLAVGGRPYMRAGRGWLPLLLVVLAANA